jgi:hypothetical protein
MPRDRGPQDSHEHTAVDRASMARDAFDMRRLFLTLASTAALVGTAAAQVDPPVVIVVSTWAAQPSSAAIQAAKPRGVASTGVASIACDARNDGSLVNCISSYADPPGKGFDGAALSLAGTLKLRPETVVIAQKAHAKVSARFAWSGDSSGPCVPPYCTAIPPPPPPPPADARPPQ